MANLKINLLLVFVSLLMTVIFLEAVFSYIMAKDKQSIEDKAKWLTTTQCMKKSENPILLYVYNGGSCGNNQHNYPGKYYPHEKNENTYRIIVIGDSVAEGLSLEPREARFGDQLENILNNNNDLTKQKIKYEVVVLARSGYSTNQQIEILKTEALLFNPDLILWSYVFNDPADPVFHNANGELGRYFYEPKSALWYFLRRSFFLVMQKIKYRYYDCDSKRDGKNRKSLIYDEILHCVYEDDILSDFKTIKAFSLKENIPIYVILHPNIFGASFNDYELQWVNDSLKNITTKVGLPMVNTIEALKKYTPDEVALSEGDPWHINTLGHRVVAEYIYSNIFREKNNVLQMP